LLRLLRLVRAFAGLHRSLERVEALLGHRELATVFIVWLAVMLLGSLGLYAAENGANAAVNSPFDALWWGVTTMTTVGYGDIYPITPEGRLAAMVLMLLGIGLFGLITGTLTSLLMRSGPASTDPLSRIRALADLRDDGIVTEQEFLAKKTKWLGRI
jgi:voltage-gated potassium channel